MGLRFGLICKMITVMPGLWQTLQTYTFISIHLDAGRESKRRARHDEKFGVKENPFYIHLEPDPLDVLNKKKQVE